MDNSGGVPLINSPYGLLSGTAEEQTGPLPPVASPLAPWQDPMRYRPPVTAPLRPVSFGTRLLARLVDVAAVALLTVLGYAVLFVVAYAVGGLSVGGWAYALLVWTLLPAVAWALYRVLGEGNSTGQTLGKAVCGIKVVATDPPAERAGMGRAFLRAAVSVLNVFLFVADLAMLFTADRRTLGDKASGTAVVATERSQPFGALTAAAVTGVLVCALAVPVAVLGHGLTGGTQDQAGSSLGTAVVQSGNGRGFGSGLDSDADDPAVGKSGGSGIGGSGGSFGGGSEVDSGGSGDVPSYDGDLASSVVSVDVPGQAANGQDGGGNTITYDGQNMLDSDPTTCWRMDGDGSGSSLTFDLGVIRQITGVGMVNGYAKVDPYTGDDRYTQERQITDVTWTFDDGTSYTQSMDAGYPDMQSLSLPTPVTTQTVTVSLDYVNSPGDANFDYTAISDVSLQGD